MSGQGRRVALVTEDRYERPTAGHWWYTDNILDEDRLVAEALAVRGIESQRVSWSRADVDWSSYDAALLRTTWDYFDRFEEFSRWLEHVVACTRLINPPDLVRWNVDKHYLRDLQTRGIHVVPTVFIERGSSLTLAELQRTHDWPEVVLKPAVSGAARHTYRIDPSTVAAHEVVLAERLREEAMLLQPFQRAILEHGEMTLVVIDGRVTHALRKRAKPGDFRVQDDHGGTVHSHAATREEVMFAERAIAACEPAPIYGRVDMIRDDSGALAVMELELVEPELWFRRAPEAAERLADTLARVL
jgi:glutathione synthase/RimK-type ligase-like ATP-grasp enzyme